MIKRSFISALLILFAAHWALGQSEGQDWVIDVQNEKSTLFSLYTEGGWLLSSYHSTDQSASFDFSSTSGFYLGAGMNLKFLKRRYSSEKILAVQAGLLYLRSGFCIEDQKVSGGYFCVPLSIQCYPIPKHGFYVETGPEFCFNLGLSPSIIEVKGANISFENHRANDIKIGLGAGYVLESIPLGVSLKYLFGLSKFAENLPWNGNQLRLGLFYRFGF